MPRNNENRLGAPMPDSDPPHQLLEDPTSSTDTLSFVVPTEFVDLPSAGRFYPPTHPLHNKEHVEIKYMTAKEEDILTSQSLLEKGLALDRLISNLLVNKKIKVDTLLVGDKSAILIAARASGYGADYETDVGCPSCGESQRCVYDLSTVPSHGGAASEGFETEGLTLNERGNFVTTLPRNPVAVEFRLLTGRDETALVNASAKRRKKNAPDSLITDQLKLMIVSINDYNDFELISEFVNTMTLADSRHLRDLYQKVCPSIELKEVFVCDSCSYEDDIIFPFTTDFFWPQQ